MTEFTKDEILVLSGLTDALNDFKKDLKNMPTRAGNSHATITVSAGGLGIWVATTACIVMLAISLIGALWASREFARSDQQTVELREQVKTTQTYLNAIYVAAPQLKPKEQENAE